MPMPMVRFSNSRANVLASDEFSFFYRDGVALNIIM